LAATICPASGKSDQTFTDQVPASWSRVACFVRPLVG
jgi:hypothetical protein